MLYSYIEYMISQIGRLSLARIPHIIGRFIWLQIHVECTLLRKLRTTRVMDYEALERNGIVKYITHWYNRRQSASLAWRSQLSLRSFVAVGVVIHAN